MLQLSKVQGFFDCRMFKAGVPRQNRVIIKDGGRVNFSCAFDSIEEIPEEAQEFAKRSEKSGKYYLTFKIFPKNCKLYTASNNLIDFPDNEKIDGGRFLVNLICNVKHGTGTELNGLYVNAMQIIKRTDNPFEAVDDGDESWISDEVESNQQPAGSESPEAKEDLPF